MHQDFPARFPDRRHIVRLGNLLYATRYVRTAGALNADRLPVSNAQNVDKAEQVLPNLREGVPAFHDLRSVAALSHLGQTSLRWTHTDPRTGTVSPPNTSPAA
jgi:hypothetical protein